MNKSIFFFAALTLLSSARIGLAEPYTGGEQASRPANAGGIFPQVSAEEASALQASLRTGAANPSQLAIMRTLWDLDVNMPEERALFAPLKAAQVGGQANVLNAALQAVMQRRQAVMNAAVRPDATQAQLEKSLDDFSQLRRLVSLYDPTSASQFEMAYLAAESRATKMRTQAMLSTMDQAIAAFKQSRTSTVEGDASIRNQSKPAKQAAASVAMEDGRIVLAKSLLKELHGTDDLRNALDSISELRGLALDNGASEALQRAVSQGLLNELRWNTGLIGANSIVASLEAIGTQTSLESSQALIVHGLMGKLGWTTRQYSDSLLSAATNIAVTSSSKDLKNETAALLFNQLKSTRTEEHKDRVRLYINKVADSAGGLANISIPTVDASQPAVPAPAHTNSKPNSLKEVIRNHPAVSALHAMLIFSAALAAGAGISTGLLADLDVAFVIGAIAAQLGLAAWSLKKGYWKLGLSVNLFLTAGIALLAYITLGLR